MPFMRATRNGGAVLAAVCLCLSPLAAVPSDFPGPYANDATAATAAVPVGAEYSDTSGIRRKRIS